MSVMSVDLTRAELVSLKETLEVTPRFEESALNELARRIVVIDLASATIRSKLDRELKRGRALVETTP